MFCRIWGISHLSVPSCFSFFLSRALCCITPILAVAHWFFVVWSCGRGCGIARWRSSLLNNAHGIPRLFAGKVTHTVNQQYNIYSLLLLLNTTNLRQCARHDTVQPTNFRSCCHCATLAPASNLLIRTQCQCVTWCWQKLLGYIQTRFFFLSTQWSQTQGPYHTSWKNTKVQKCAYEMHHRVGGCSLVHKSIVKWNMDLEWNKAPATTVAYSDSDNVIPQSTHNSSGRSLS